MLSPCDIDKSGFLGSLVEVLGSVHGQGQIEDHEHRPDKRGTVSSFGHFSFDFPPFILQKSAGVDASRTQEGLWYVTWDGAGGTGHKSSLPGHWLIHGHG